MKITKRIFALFAILFLLMPPAFLSAQEEPLDAAQSAAHSADTEKADAESGAHSADADSVSADYVSAATEKFLEADAVTAASRVKMKLNFFQRLGIAVGIVIGQVLLMRLIWYLFKRINIKLESSGKEKIKPLTIKKFKLLSQRQIVGVIEALLRILKYAVTIVMIIITIPVVFSLFYTTRNLASTLFDYILDPVKHFALSVVSYIPNLFKIIIFVLITHYVLRVLKFLALQISRGKLVIPRFYPEWAEPTLKILQVLLWAFTIAIIYPYLPGSDSRAFQGVSVFIGIIFSLGSSTAIGNLVAGLVITYMRPFKIGDRVQIKDITGFVVEKNLMVVRLKTHKNEYVTFPNLIILGSSIINYNTSSDEDEEGLILFAEVTFGYSTPWQTIHDILINAALATEHVQKRPKPFVLQTQLDDFYARYQINCYTKEVSKVPAIYTMLYENIQNGFNEAGLDMTAAHYRVITKKA